MAAPSFASLFVLLAILVAAACVARRGLRWRREPVPSTCRTCGYDVSRRPAGVERCSECGADLARPHAILAARRDVNRWVLYPAIVVFAFAGGALVGDLIDFPYRRVFYERASVAWIRFLARRDRGASGDTYRFAWHERDPSPAYVDHLLDLQGDAHVAWRFELEHALEDAFRGGSTSDAQRGRFVRQLFGQARLRVRTPLRVGDPLFVEMTANARVAFTSQPLYARSAIAAQVDGEPDLAEPAWSNEAVADRLTWALAPERWGGVGLAPG